MGYELVTRSQTVPIPDSETVGAGRQDRRVVRTERHRPRLSSVSWHQQLGQNCSFRFTFTEVQRTRLYAVVLQQCHNLWKMQTTPA